MSCEQLPATRRRGQRRTRARQRAREQAQLQLAQANGRAAQSKAAEERYHDLIEDLEWLLQAGESPELIAVRLGYANPASLARRLSRHGRNDLALIYWRLEQAERVSL